MTATTDTTDWRSAGACLRADPDLFFPVSGSGPAEEQITKATAICARCPVREPCLEFALATGQQHGIWGGTRPEERLRLRRRQRQASPAPGSAGPPR
jgi:WhiB family redox-sensing transcriptional regulator